MKMIAQEHVKSSRGSCGSQASSMEFAVHQVAESWFSGEVAPGCKLLLRATEALPAT